MGAEAHRTLYQTAKKAVITTDVLIIVLLREHGWFF